MLSETLHPRGSGGSRVELLCPKCSTTQVEPLQVVLLRRYGLTALGTFFVGMVVMLMLGLFGMIKLGGVLWVSLSLLPVALFFNQRHQHREDPLYQHGYACTFCGHRWLPVREGAPRERPELKDRLRLLEEQRQATPPPDL